MKIAIAGSGALGSGFGAKLFQAQDMMSHLLTDIHLMLKRLSNMD
ncbi:hypothetical protein MQA_01479 [Staphylococcus aureus subsp. aureus VRS1]|nr:hypothetical protein MQA_01479 [Staphylococcus aureus subsp. aureus VRS1]